MTCRSLLLSPAKQWIKYCGYRNFSVKLTPRQLEIQARCRNFAVKYLMPNAAKRDKDGCFPEDSIRQLAQMGLMGATIDPKYGGADLDMLSLALAVEETSRACASTGVILSIHNCLYANMINQKGTEIQKEHFLNDFAKGKIGCFALSEPDAGSDAANIMTVATDCGDFWSLTGTKSWVTSAIQGKAAIVFATVNPELKHSGLTCFIVPLDSPGIHIGKKEETMGIRAASVSHVRLESVAVPRWHQIDVVGHGFRLAMQQLDQARIGIAAHALGIAQATLDTALDYSSKRIVFGKPLNRISAVQDRLADMSVQIACLRLLTYQAATEVCTKNSALAKYSAGRAATACADHCVQILGANGLSAAHPAERLYRDARGTQIYGGVTDVQKMILAHNAIKEHRMTSQ